MSKPYKHFLLVDFWPEEYQFVEIYNCIQRRNLAIHVVCTQTLPWLTKYVHPSHIIVTDTYNSQKTLNDVLAYAIRKSIRFAGIGTFNEQTVITASDLAAAFQLPCLHPDAARRSSTNKGLMLQCCKNAGIPVPQFKLVRAKYKNILDACRVIAFPCVIKPVVGESSYGVTRIDKPVDIRPALQKFSVHVKKKKYLKRFKDYQDQLLIESYVAGILVSVDGVVQNKDIQIAGVVEYSLADEIHFVLTEGFLPSRLSASHEQSCIQMAKQIVRAVGFDNTFFHCELKLTKDGPRLIEIAARIPGGIVPSLYLKAFNISIHDLALDIMIGKKVTTQKKRIKKYTYTLVKRYFKKGTFVCIRGVQSLYQIKELFDYRQFVKGGDKLVTYPEVPTRIYRYAITANTRKEIENTKTKIDNKLKIIVRKIISS